MTKPVDGAEALEVTPEDLATYLALGIFHTCEDRMILAGWADESSEMQRIVAHRLAGVKEGLEMARTKADEAVTKVQTLAITEQRQYYTPNEAGAVDLGCSLIAELDAAIRAIPVKADY